ncbi:MAG: RDD family protein [Chloroflexi bacterium]|nr:RDD family protein [Chloroflexota bacterium]
MTHLAIQLFFLATRGPILGKMATGVSIVTDPGGYNPGFVKAAIVRLIAPMALTAVTFLIFTLVDALFIFRDGRKTIHDMMAGTVVVHRRQHSRIALGAGSTHRS